MGKGDKKTRRGKLWRGSHGKTRPKPKAPVAQKEAPVAKAKAKPVKPKVRKKKT